MMQNSGPVDSSARAFSHGRRLLPSPGLHADLAPAPALAVADRQRSAPVVEIMRAERERLLDAQPSAPQDNDHRPHAPAVTVIGSVTHHRHDLVHRGRVGRVSESLVAWRAAGVIARQRRRRAAASRRVEH